MSTAAPAAYENEHPRHGHPDEESPLLEQGSNDGGLGRGDEQEGEEEDRSQVYLLLLTLGIGGLQIAWATEMSNGSPFLISLGMSKPVLALVWIAGPLSGILVQPYIGNLSDRCRLPWGKRRPFMVAGTVATVISLLALAWCREIMACFHQSLGLDSASDSAHTSVVIFAALLVYILDFAINTVQAALRAFVVDCAPSHQQEDANAWASRLTGLGNIVGHLLAYGDLPRMFPFLGNTQFKVLCALAAIALVVTVGISALSITERDPRLDGPPKGSNVGLLAFFRTLSKSANRLPYLTRKVCGVQFFNWIAWFPFMFYVSTYVGQLYVNPILEERPHLTPEELDSIWVKATRAGSFALFLFAITSFTSNALLPFFVMPTNSRPRSSKDSDLTIVGRALERVRVPGLTLRRAWLFSQILFALCMVLTFFISSTEGANVLAAVVGISWALTLWAPYALISVDISRQALINRSQHASVDDSVDDPHTGALLPEEHKHDVEDQAGIVLGLHNVAISAPQVLSTLISSAIFKIAQRDRGAAGDDSVGWVLRFGGGASLIAAFLTAKIEDA